MKLLDQVSRFVVIGCVATLMQYTVLIVLVQSGLADAVTASGFGFVSSALLNYILNRRFTFFSEAAHRKTAFRFTVVAVSGLSINSGLLFWMDETWGLHYLVAQLCATAVVLVWNFLLSRFWTFSSSAKAPLHVKATHQ